MKNKSASQLVLTGLFAVLVLAASPSIVRAQECPGSSNWIGGTGSWFTGSNWSNGCVPTATIDATINNGGHAQNLGGSVHAVAKSLILGDDQEESGSVTVDHDNSSYLDLGNSTCRGTIYVGNRGSGNLTLRNNGYIRSRYAYVAAAENPERPASNGTVHVEGSGTIWFIYDNVNEPTTCTGAGLFIGGTADGNGGTATVDVSNGGIIAVYNNGDAPGVTVGLSGTLTGNGVVYHSGATALAETTKVLGTLAPKGGALEIRGNLNLDFISTNTVFSVTTQAQDKVNVTSTNGGGAATLGGRVTVAMTGGGFTPNTSFTLLHADAGRNNTTFDFESITYDSGPYDPCIAPSISYDANNVYLTVDDC
jgi:T5SS/PEP-CTERM-associated repeat protein